MNSTNPIDMKLVNFRMPVDMKTAFHTICKYNGSDMSRVLTSMVRDYLTKESQKLHTLKSEIHTIGEPIKPTSKTTKRDGWYDDIKNDENPTQRQGEWVLNQHTKTWELG